MCFDVNSFSHVRKRPTPYAWCNVTVVFAAMGETVVLLCGSKDWSQTLSAPSRQLTEGQPGACTCHFKCSPAVQSETSSCDRTLNKSSSQRQTAAQSGRRSESETVRLEDSQTMSLRQSETETVSLKQ